MSSKTEIEQMSTQTPSNSTLSFLKVAIQEAQNSDMHQKHGCVLVSSGKILARGHNHTRNSISNQAKQLHLPNDLAPLCSIHAEMHCLLNFARLKRRSKPVHSEKHLLAEDFNQCSTNRRSQEPCPRQPKPCSSQEPSQGPLSRSRFGKAQTVVEVV